MSSSRTAGPADSTALARGAGAGPCGDGGVRQSLEQKVGLSPADPAFRYQTDKDQRASEPVRSRVGFLQGKTHPAIGLVSGERLQGDRGNEGFFPPGREERNPSCAGSIEPFRHFAVCH
jgi:hypothetical protein